MPDVPRAHETATVPRWIHAEPRSLRRRSPCRSGGATEIVAAPGLVTLTPSSVSTMSTTPHEPQPCEKLSLLLSLTGVVQGAVEQPGFHCSHMNVPPSARSFAGPSALASVSSETT